MLADHVDDRLGQAVLARQLHAVAGVLRQNRGRNARVGLVVRVFAHLVFLKIHRANQLADVVIICADAGKQRVRADRLRRGLRQVRDHHRVVIGARRFDHQPPQERLIRVGKLDQLGGRDEVERRFQNRLQADAEHGGNHRAADGVGHIRPHAAHVAGRQRADADEDAEIHRADHKAADHDHHAGRVFAHHPDGDQPAQRTGQQDAHRLRRDQPRALRRQQGDNQRQRHVGHIRRARAQQVDHQHRAQRDGHGVDVQIFAHQQAQQHRQHARNQQHQRARPHAQHRLCEQISVQIRARQNQRQRDRRADVERVIEAVALQQAEGFQHRDLLGRHPVALDHDVLILLVDRRLHRVAGLLPVFLRRRLVDQHVRLEAGAQRRNRHVIPQIRPRVVGDDLLNVVDRVVDLPLGDGGNQRRARGGDQRLIQAFKIALACVHQRAELVIAQRQPRDQPGGLRIIRLGERTALVAPCVSNLLAQLANGAQFGKHRVHVGEHGVGNRVVFIIDGGNRVRRGLPAPLGRQFIDDILAGRDRLGRDVAHAQIVLLRRNRQQADRQQDEVSRRRKQRLLHAKAQAVNPFAGALARNVHRSIPPLRGRRARHTRARWPAPARGEPRRDASAAAR